MSANSEGFRKLIVGLLSTPTYRYRIKLLNDSEFSSWSKLMTEPVNGYIEPMSTGPVLKKDVQLIEIDPVVKTRKGRLVPDAVRDDLAAIESVLKKAGAIYRVNDGIICVTVCE